MRSTLLSLIPRWRRWPTERGEAGQSLVEFALALPIVALVLLGGVDLSRGYAIQIALQNAARGGAEAALIGTASTGSAIATYVRNELAGTPGNDPSTATVIISRGTESGVCFVTVRVWYTHRTLVAWPGIPNVARIDRTTKVRDFRPVVAGDADDSEDSQDSQDDEGGTASGQTNASNPTDCDDSGGSDTNSGSQDESQATPTQGTATDDSEE